MESFADIVLSRVSNWNNILLPYTHTRSVTGLILELTTVGWENAAFSKWTINMYLQITILRETTTLPTLPNPR